MELLDFCSQVLGVSGYHCREDRTWGGGEEEEAGIITSKSASENAKEEEEGR